jgi:putative PEP-CTERM system TPR-repeat lipoprotein
MKKSNRLGISSFAIAGVVFLGLALATPAHAAKGNSVASEEFYQDAKRYLEKGDPNSAVIQLKNALQKDRGHIGARKLLGDIYLNVGNGPAAEKELKAARRGGANEIGIEIGIARAYAMQGKFKQILRELQDSVADNAVRSDILQLRGNAYFGLGMNLDARGSFEEAINLDPNGSKAKVGLAKIFVTTGNLKGAEPLVDAAIKVDPNSAEALVLKGELGRLKNDPQGALAAFDGALRIDKLNIPALLGRAATYIDLNKDDHAQSDIEAVYRRVPKQPLASFLSALILAKKKDFVGAQEMLQQGSPALDNHMPSVFLNGAVHYALDQLEQAADLLGRYVASVPNNVRARKLLGATLVRTSDLENAISILEPLVDDKNTDAQVLALLGSAYMRTGKFSQGSELFERAVKAAPDASAIRTQLALSRLVQGSSEQAVGDLEAAVDLDPDARQASVLLTLVHLRQAQFDKALESASRLHKNMPNNPMAQNLMGAAYLGKEDLAKARENFEAALKTKSDFHPARMNLAQLDAREGNVDGAMNQYQLILDNDPKNLGAMMALADIALSQKNVEKSVEWIKKASDANPKAVLPKLRLVRHFNQQRDTLRALSIARDLDRTVPDNPQVLEALGRTEITAGNVENAVAIFRRLASIADKAARAHHLLGSALAQSGDRVSARASFNKAIDLDIEFLPAFVALAELESADGNAKTALSLAGQITEKRPKSAVGAMLTGDIYMRSKQYGSALASYKEAASKEDTGSLALRIFSARSGLGRKEEGLRELQDWVDRKDESGVRHALANAYIANQRIDDAIRESEKLLSKESSNPVVLNNLAWLYDQKGDPRAIVTGTKALELSPNSPEILDTVGWILARQGDLARGTEMLKKAYRAAPKQGDIAYHLAVALNKGGKVLEARRTLERLFQSQVNFSESANAQKLLKELGG